jgi:hypothetical protein
LFQQQQEESIAHGVTAAELQQAYVQHGQQPQLQPLDWCQVLAHLSAPTQKQQLQQQVQGHQQQQQQSVHGLDTASGESQVLQSSSIPAAAYSKLAGMSSKGSCVLP